MVGKGKGPFPSQSSGCSSSTLSRCCPSFFSSKPTPYMHSAMNYNLNYLYKYGISLEKCVFTIHKRIMDKLYTNLDYQIPNKII